MNKLGRNHLCWCGSGKKYKNCHYRRETDSPILLNDFLSVHRKIWTKEYCLHPQQSSCSGNIVQAHTIQRGGSLEIIARDGHVYTFKTDTAKILKTGTLEINLVGINKASTFTGFCSYHDNYVFKPIEGEVFSISEETSFLLAYRVLCHELFLKKAWREELLYAKDNLDKGKSLSRQIEIQDIADQFLIGVEAGLNDLMTIKARYDEILIKHDYTAVRYYVIVLEEVPDFVCSGFTQAVYDFHGNQLQDLADLNIISENLSFSIIATDFGGVIIYSWAERNISSARLIESLMNLNPQKQVNASARFAFENFENLFISPNWWEALDPQLQQKIFQRHLSGTPDHPHMAAGLIDDGLDLVSWKVRKIETNLRKDELQNLS